MARYKYVCEECTEATFFSARERTRHSGMRCRHCGCRHLNPSKASAGPNTLAVHAEIKEKYDAITDVKQGIK